MLKTFTLFVVVSIPLGGNGQFFLNPYAERSTHQTQHCRLQNNGIGYCAHFSQCRIAQAAYRNFGVQPAICARNPFDPIVCCPSGGSQSERLQQNPHPRRNGGQRVGGRISEMKCQEMYAPTERVFKPLVVGGVRTAPGEFPHMVYMVQLIRSHFFYYGVTISLG